MTKPADSTKRSSFPDELSEVRPREEDGGETPSPERLSRGMRLVAKAAEIETFLRGKPPGRRQELLRTALLRKDEALLDGLLEELRGQTLL